MKGFTNDAYLGQYLIIVPIRRFWKITARYLYYCVVRRVSKAYLLGAKRCSWCASALMPVYDPARRGSRRAHLDLCGAGLRRAINPFTVGADYRTGMPGISDDADQLCAAKLEQCQDQPGHQTQSACFLYRLSPPAGVLPVPLSPPTKTRTLPLEVKALIVCLSSCRQQGAALATARVRYSTACRQSSRYRRSRCLQQVDAGIAEGKSGNLAGLSGRLPKASVAGKNSAKQCSQFILCMPLFAH